MRTTKKQNTLICTLGTSAPIIAETLNYLIKKNIMINKLIIVHTNSKVVLNKEIEDNSGNKKDIGLKSLLTHLKNKYPDVSVKTINLCFDDFYTLDDNNTFLSTMLQLLNDEQQEGNDIYLGIAGGRKTMSAIALFAGYLIGVTKVYHILVNNEKEIEITKQYGFDIPLDNLNLIEIPNINLSGILDTVLKDIEYDNNLVKYLEKEPDLNNLLTEINKRLSEGYERKKLKNQYEQNYSRYERLLLTIEYIMRKKIEDANITEPFYAGRIKSFESFFNKFRGRGDINKLLDANDIAGFKIITFFNKDINEISDIIKKSKEFDLFAYEDKSGKDTLYKALHLDVKLSNERTKLIEYEDLKDLKCEIQVKTAFADVWARMEHRLVYKSEQFAILDTKDQNKIMKTFEDAAQLLYKTERKIDKIRKHYNYFSTNDKGG